MQYVILGNSAAAVAAVDAIRSRDAEGSITMVSPEERNAYGTPLISYVLQGKTELERTDIRDDAWYATNDVERVFGEGKAATFIDVDAKKVMLEDGTQLAYDKLLVACGSVPSAPRVEGLTDDAPNSFFFNTMDDTLAIQEYLDNHDVKNVVVSGSGLIGAKAAEGICAHVDKTYLVGHAPRILRKLLDDEASALLAALMAEHSIENVPGTVVESVECAADGAVTAVKLENGRALPCDLLITAIGVRPNAAMLEAAGAKVSRGAVCDAQMRTSLSDVYAAGDVANTHNTLLGEDAPLALWPTASEQGHVAGLAMAGDEKASFDGSFARNAVGFFGKMNILGCGIINPGPEQPDVESLVSNDGDVYTKFNIRDGKLVGYLLMNRPDSAGVYTAIISKGVPLDALPDDIFDRAPQLHDLPKAMRDGMLLRGYSARKGE